jgi:DNA polymerase-3 subunit delta
LTAHVGAKRDEAVEVLRGDEVTWIQVIDIARSPSLFSPQRVVLVRGAESLRGPDEGVGGYLGDPTPGTLLILQAAKPDRRKGVWKKVLEQAEVVNAEPLKGRTLRGHVTGELRRRKLQLSEDAVDELIERVGGDLRRLMGEIDKLEAFGRGERALGVDAVDEVLGKGLARPLYRLADAFCERRAAEALELIDELIGEGEAGVRILATLHRALRQVSGARELDASGRRSAIAERLGVPPFKVDAVLRASRAWTDADVLRAYHALREADLRIKSSVDARLALSAAVAHACRAPQSAKQVGRPSDSASGTGA